MYRIPNDHLRRVVRIAVCGQMHGIMFWKNGSGWKRNAEAAGHVSSNVPLIKISVKMIQDSRHYVAYFILSCPPSEAERGFLCKLG